MLINSDVFRNLLHSGFTNSNDQQFYMKDSFVLKNIGYS